MSKKESRKPFNLPMPGVQVTSMGIGTPTTLLAEAKRLQKEWHDTVPPHDDAMLEKAGDIIDALVALVVVAVEHTDVQRELEPPIREFRFDGTERYPSFVIVTQGNEIKINVNPALWRFDLPDGNMSEELWAEMTAPFDTFLYRPLNNKTLSVIASSLRNQFTKLVHEGIITKKSV